MAVSRVARGALIALVIVIVLGLLTGFFWLRSLGQFLVHADSPQKADIILVLAGDWTGQRILTGAELATRGYAPKVWVSGPFPLYGVNEATLAINYAVEKGYPRSLFEPKFLASTSTRSEAAAFKREFDKANIHKILLVTSNFHTRRVNGIYKRVLGDGYQVNVISAPYNAYNPDDWWKRREDRKTWFFEVTKTFAETFGF